MKFQTVVAVLLTTFAAAPTATATPLLTGPLYPIPFAGATAHGGSACFATGGTPGSTLGTTWTFGAGTTPLTTQTCPPGATVPAPFDTSKFERLYWGIDGSTNKSPRVAMDGAYTPPAEILVRSVDSRPADGLLVWEGTTQFQGCLNPCGGSFSQVNVQTRLEVRVTTLAGGPVALVDQAAAGVAIPLTNAVVPIIPALTNFRVNISLLARNANAGGPGGGPFQPAEAFYNLWSHSGGAQLISSLSGAFWYQNRLPLADFTFSTPQANVPITFNATYSDPDGEINSIGWDFDNDGNYAELDRPSGQWAFPAGSHVVSFRVNDQENPQEFTIVKKTIDVPPGPLDRDGDGYPASLDCDDSNAAIHPGALEIPGNAVDEDCSAGPAPFPNLSPSPRLVFSYTAYARYTRFRSLTIRDIPRGSDITVSCSKPKACPKKIALRNQNGTVNLRALRNRRIAVNTVIEVRITKAGFIGTVKRVKIRRAKAPKVTSLCLTPGAATPSVCR